MRHVNLSRLLFIHSQMLNCTRNLTSRVTMKLDPAVVKLLQLDADSTSVSSAGGGGCSSASTSKIASKLSNGTEKTFFMKTGTGSSATTMFEGKSHVFASQVLMTDWVVKENTHRSTQSMLPSHHYVRNPLVMESLNQIRRPRSL